MRRPKPALIAVDGLNGRAMMAAARKVSKGDRGRSGHGISRWDASGLFDQLVVAGDEAGTPSVRTLLLLYAADLAFRLRWEIQPAMAEGRTVVAAPYVDTAMAFGRAAGVPAGWLGSLFHFAPQPAERHHVVTAMPRAARVPDGFVEFGCARLAGNRSRLTRGEFAARIRRHLRKAAVRATKQRR